MARGNIPHLSFNRGEVGKTALARVDLERMRLSAETQLNWTPSVLGPMMLRPGTKYIGNTRDDTPGKLLPFVFANDDLALLEFTSARLRIWNVEGDSETLVTRPSVGTVIPDGTFGNVGDWVLTESGANSAADIADGVLTLACPTANGIASAVQRAAVAAVDLDKEHALSIRIDRGPVRFRCGYAVGADNLIAETDLATGRHSLAFVPTSAHVVVNGNFSTDTIWNKGTGWSIAAGKASSDASQTGDSDIFQTLSGLVEGRSYLLSFTVSGRSAGTITPLLGGTTGTPRSTNAIHTESIEVGSATTIRFRASDDFDGSIDDVTLSAEFYVQFETISAQQKIVNSIEIEGPGVLELSTPYGTSFLPLIRLTQSGDIVFLACNGLKPRQIERRSTRSWSLVEYQPADGPFGVINVTDITLTAGALKGNTTLSASRPLFRDSHVGSLFRLFTSGQTRQATLNADDTYTDPVRISGVGNARVVSLNVEGTWAGTITLHRSTESADAGFSLVTGYSPSDTFPTFYADPMDNVIVWYRAGFGPDSHTSGSAEVTLSYGGGGDSGVGRVTSVTSETVAEIEILTDFSSLTPTKLWNEGDWSDRQGWPSAVAFHDGRLWWAGRDRIWASISDAYNSFDIDFEGDAGPINRTVGFGPVANINWLLPLTRLIIGREGSETSVRSGALDEPLSPTNFTLKDCSTQGSTPVQAVKIDTRGVFIEQSNRRVYELAFSGEAMDFIARDMTRLNPDIGVAGFIRVDVQRQPDTILHFVRNDGQVVQLLSDRDDEVEAWYRLETDGTAEDVCILPGALENRVYYIVRRSIDGQTVRTIERLARRDQCSGLPEARLSDCHVIQTRTSPATTITGLDHLEGERVVIWGWEADAAHGDDCGTGLNAAGEMVTRVVSGGSVPSPTAYRNFCVGLPYTARFKSAKLAYVAERGTALNQKKKINRLGLVLADTHFRGLRAGQSFERMDPLPLVKDGVDIAADTVHADYDNVMLPARGEWNTDSRLCLLAASPRPCTVMAAVMDLTTNE